MMTPIDIDSWLRDHSTSVHPENGMIRYLHANGCVSQLRRRNISVTSRLDVYNPMVAEFYKDYEGGHIGNYYLMIATDLRGGIKEGFVSKVLDFAEAKALANSKSHGVIIPADQEVFMTTPSGLPAYAYSTSAHSGYFTGYDYSSPHPVPRLLTMSEILEDCWSNCLSRKR